MDVSIESNHSEGSPRKKIGRQKKRSLVERELETNLTTKITSPINTDGSPSDTSRYGRARKQKTEADNSILSLNNSLKSPSPVKKLAKKSQTPIKNNESQNKTEKQVFKELIQTPNKTPQTNNSHLNNILERSADKYSLSSLENDISPTLLVAKEINISPNKKRKRKANKIKEEPELNDLEKACVFQIGDVAWARMGSYPFWPCIICRDPFSDVFVKIKAKGKVERQYIHVLFFGDGQRGWIQENNLRKYDGLPEFLDAQKQLSSEIKKKDPKLYAAYFVSEKQQIKWKKSVEEADSLLIEPQILRLEIYNQVLISKLSAKTLPKKNKEKPAKVTRKSSNVSFSESILDSLFSEEDTKKADEAEPSRRKQNKTSLDVSKVVTACLDDMAAKTGMSKIQKESHMDRWLQKAKSKTPEKSQIKKKSKNNPETKETKEIKEKNIEILTKKKLRKNTNENSHKRNLKTPSKEMEPNFKPYIKNGFGIGYITKVQSLTDEEHKCIVENKIEPNALIDGEVFLANDDVCDEVVVEMNEDELIDNSEINLNGRSTPPECIINHNKSNVSDYIRSDEIDLSIDNEQENKDNSSNIIHIIFNKQDVENKINEIENVVKNNCDNLQTANHHIQNDEDFSIEKNDSKDNTCLIVSDENTVISLGCSSSSSNIENNKLSHDINNKDQNTDFVLEDSVENLLDDLIIDDNIKDLKPEYDNRDFVLYVQSNKDTIMEENPDLSHREILEYLYDTWSYEYSKSRQKSEEKKVHNTRKRNDLNNKSAKQIFRESEKKINLSLAKRSPSSSEKKTKTKKHGKIKINNGDINTSDKHTKEKGVVENDDDLKNSHPILLIENDEYITKLTLKEKDLNINIEEPNALDQKKIEQENSINCNNNDIEPMSLDNQLSKTDNITCNTNEPISMSDCVINKTIVNVDTDKAKLINDEMVKDAKLCNKKVNLVQNTEIGTSEDFCIINKNISNNNFNDNCSSPNVISEIDSIVTEIEFNKEKNDPIFLKYVEMERDLVTNENPELFEHEIIFHLYKTWRCQKDNKTDNNEKKSKQKDLYSNSANEDNICEASSDVSTIFEHDILDVGSISPSLVGKSISQDSNDSEIKKKDSSLDIKFRKRISNGDTKCNGVSIIDKITSYSTDPEFLEYVELKQDSIFEEHSELSEKDILSYLYKTWIYEQDKVGEDKKIGYLKESSVVKGLNLTDNEKPKRISKHKSNDKKKIKDNLIGKEVKNISNDQVIFKINEMLNEPTDKVDIVEVNAINNVEEKIVPKNRNMENDIDVSNYISMDIDKQASSIEISDSNLKSSFNIKIIPEARLKDTLSEEKSSNDGNTCKLKQCYNNPHFIQYVELKQDVIIDENPDLSEEAILEYLYDTWKYEEELKTEEMKNDDLKQNNLVKGLEQVEDKKSCKLKTTDSYIVNEPVIKVNIAEKGTEVNLTEKVTDIHNHITGDIKVKNKSDSKLIISIKKSALKESKSTLDKWLISTNTKQSPKTSLVSVPISETKQTNVEENKILEKPEKNRKKHKSNQEKNTYKSVSKEILAEKQEDPPITLVDFDQDIPKHVTDKTLSKYQDPEFLKYLELRQDVVIDDYPDLSMDDIIVYLYKTWSYEEKIKSDDRKNDDIQQSKLVKGLGDVVEPVIMKRVYKKKAKADKSSDSDDIEYQKDKPSRKMAVKSYYNESEDFSDSSNDEFLDLTKKEIQKTITGDGEIEGQVFDEVEYFLHQMTLPKPNVFKGLNRERVCEICEKPNDLVKCKGCMEMFHVECVCKPDKIEDSQPLLKARKKKKPRGKKPKNDSGDDISLDDNERSGEELETIDLVGTAAEFEAQMEEKMIELLRETENFDYSQYTSDEDIDWSTAVPGRCEIIDVKLKKRQIELTENFKCKTCQKFDKPLCFVCKEAISPKNKIEIRQKCNVSLCSKFYHLECLDHWPQTQWGTKDISKNGRNSEAITCPRHVCHTCVCDDPRGCKTRFSADKLAKCVRCPAVYHSFTKCLPAGTKILSASHVICPRHYELKPGKVPCHVNTGWCFICALGGTLICCEYCPTSFHAECLKIKPPEGNYMCEDCETGRLPLYGEMVWVKLGHYRWWPGLILHPSEIPDNVMAIKHYFGEFVVRFFGQYDHYWVNRGRVFPFQEGDTGKISSQKSKIDAAFTRAIEDAYKACEVLKTVQPNKEESLDIASSLLAPHYVKLKVNRPYGALVNWKPDDSEANSMTQCECDPNDVDPCGPDSQCLNRMLATECGPPCRAGDRCFNRNFEKRNYPKMTPYRTSYRGWGLKTLVDIKKGQFIIEYVGELIDDEEIQRRMKRKHEIRDENYYFLTLDKDRTIDAGPKGNFSRFMNHSCEPNCETQKWTVLGDVRVGLFAIQDIPANSELTFNYHFECAGMEKKQCMCGAKLCAGFMGAKVKQMDYQPKRPKITEKTNKKAQRKSKKHNLDSPSTSKPRGRPKNPVKPQELTEIEKDLLLITNASNNAISDSESDKTSLTNIDLTKNLKRKRSIDENSSDSLPSGKKCKVGIEVMDGNTLKSLLNGS